MSIRPPAILVLVIVAYGCKGFEPETEPPAWVVSVDTSDFVGMRKLYASAGLLIRNLVWMEIGCAKVVGGTDDPTRSVTVNDFRPFSGPAFSNPPLVSTYFFPDVGLGQIEWGTGPSGGYIVVSDQKADGFAARAVAADSVVVHWMIEENLRPHKFDTRALSPALGTVKTACNWTF